VRSRKSDRNVQSGKRLIPHRIPDGERMMDEIQITQVEFLPVRDKPEIVRKPKPGRQQQQSASIPEKGRKKPDGGMK